MTFQLAHISSALHELGAHIGHLRVESYAGLSFYVLGGRSYYIVFDISKTVPLLKNALLFVEQLVLRFGHVVFCYSDVVQLNIQFRRFIARLVNKHNHSFSYLRWVPGCVTNYRYVFLRLVDVMFMNLRTVRNPLLREVSRTDSFAQSYIRLHAKLWLLFTQQDMLYGKEDVQVSRQRFLNIFSNRKNLFLDGYFSSSMNRNIDSFHIARRQGSTISNAALELDTFNESDDVDDQNDIHLKGEHSERLREIPDFLSLLIRVCYIIRSKFKLFLDENEFLDQEWLFRSLYMRMLAFWRAIIFFRFFKKTANLPDCLVMLNPSSSTAEFNDFKGVRLPIICIADTVSHVENITYPIPSNDDSIILLFFYFRLFLNASDSACATRTIWYDLL